MSATDQCEMVNGNEYEDALTLVVMIEVEPAGSQGVDVAILLDDRVDQSRDEMGGDDEPNFGGGRPLVEVLVRTNRANREEEFSL